MVDKNLENLEWRCADCKETAPPTAYDYMRFLKHAKGHHVRLVDKTTGEIIAATPKQCREKGIDIPRASAGATPMGLELSEEGLTLPVTLPPVLFTMFDAAKAAGLIDNDRDLDSWLFECVQKRFELDYHYKFMLMPIKEGEAVKE